jgi:hypothetical protein
MIAQEPRASGNYALTENAQNEDIFSSARGFRLPQVNVGLTSVPSDNEDS